MATGTLEARVIELVRVETGFEGEIGRDSSWYTDLALDSLDTIEIIMAVEEEFYVEIQDEDAEKMETVGAIIDYLEKAGVK